MGCKCKNAYSFYLGLYVNLIFVMSVGLTTPLSLYAITGLEIMIKEDERDKGQDLISTSVFRLINKRGQQGYGAK